MIIVFALMTFGALTLSWLIRASFDCPIPSNKRIHKILAKAIDDSEISFDESIAIIMAVNMVKTYSFWRKVYWKDE